jgi:type II secretory pathway pseudopilin PulG
MSKVPRKIEAFSLVEVTIAIGIFAFVIVGIIGLFPTALRMQAESSVETRASMIAQQLFDSVDLSIAKWTNPTGNVFSNITLRDGPGLVLNNARSVNLLNPSRPVVVGYQVKSSMPFYLWKKDGEAAWRDGIGPQSEGHDEDPDDITGKDPGPAPGNDIITLAWISATNVPGNSRLYQINVEVRSPAFAPLTNTPPSVFTTYRVLP